MERAQILESISQLTVLELSQLIKDMEETFGVSISIDDLELENFRSIANIAGVVARHTTMVEAV